MNGGWLHLDQYGNFDTILPKILTLFIINAAFTQNKEAKNPDNILAAICKSGFSDDFFKIIHKSMQVNALSR